MASVQLDLNLKPAESVQLCFHLGHGLIFSENGGKRIGGLRNGITHTHPFFGLAGNVIYTGNQTGVDPETDPYTRLTQLNVQQISLK